MSHFVRASKYRHVYAQAPKTGYVHMASHPPILLLTHPPTQLTSLHRENYANIRLSTAVGEQNYVKGNPLYFAVALQVRVGRLPRFPLHPPTSTLPSPTHLPSSPTHLIHQQGGGGPFTVVPYEKKGAFPISPPVFGGHTSNVLDFDFNPFHDQIIASASEDCTVKLW